MSNIEHDNEKLWQTIPWPQAPLGWHWDQNEPCVLERDDEHDSGFISIVNTGRFYERCAGFSGIPPEALRALIQRAKDIQFPGWG